MPTSFTLPDGFYLLTAYVLGALGISFLCSLLEAALLSAREPELQAKAGEGNLGAALLLEIKQNRLDDAISAILTLNTIAHTIGATLAGAQAAKVFGSAWVGVFSGVLTLLVLVGTEIIPKTWGAMRAVSLAGFVGRTVQILIYALYPVIRVTGFLTGIIADEKKAPVSRAEIAALLATATGQGTLHKDQKRFFDNVLELDKVVVEDVMTPRTVALMLPDSATARNLMDKSESRIFSRIPIFSESRDNVLGYIVTREVLEAVARSGDLDMPLNRYLHKAWFLEERDSISIALKEFLHRREHLAMVNGEFGSVTGLVTLEDVVETLLGMEIVDESDRIADMRLLAKKVRDARTRAREEAGDA